MLKSCRFQSNTYYYIISTGLCGPTATSATPEKVDDEDEDFDEEDSAEADDVKNQQKRMN